MATYEPLYVFSLEGGDELFRIVSLGVQPRENDVIKYDDVTYKVESVVLELARKGPIGDSPAFWNTVIVQVGLSVIP